MFLLVASSKEFSVLNQNTYLYTSAFIFSKFLSINIILTVGALPFVAQKGTFSLVLECITSAAVMHSTKTNMLLGSRPTTCHW